MWTVKQHHDNSGLENASLLWPQNLIRVKKKWEVRTEKTKGKPKKERRMKINSTGSTCANSATPTIIRLASGNHQLVLRAHQRSPRDRVICA